MPHSFTAARKRKEQLGTFDNTDDISINPACTPRQTGKRSTI
jgi:hypothetical protein